MARFGPLTLLWTQQERGVDFGLGRVLGKVSVERFRPLPARASESFAGDAVLDCHSLRLGIGIALQRSQGRSHSVAFRFAPRISACTAVSPSGANSQATLAVSMMILLEPPATAMARTLIASREGPRAL